MKDSFPTIKIKVVATDDHVVDIERCIRDVKEAIRCIVQSLPYLRYPILTLNFFVEEVLKFKNSLPTTTGISDTISPSKLVLEKPTLDYNEMRIEFGSYMQVFEERRATNTTATRSIGAIALTLSPDSTGLYQFMNINT